MKAGLDFFEDQMIAEVEEKIYNETMKKTHTMHERKNKWKKKVWHSAPLIK